MLGRCGTRGFGWTLFLVTVFVVLFGGIVGCGGWWLVDISRCVVSLYSLFNLELIEANRLLVLACLYLGGSSHLKFGTLLVVDAVAIVSEVSLGGAAGVLSIGFDWFSGRLWPIFTRGRLPSVEDEGDAG